ncbi:hypothetical protein GCM10027168_43950 [Streptomyces capparidis]
MHSGRASASAACQAGGPREHGVSACLLFSGELLDAVAGAHGAGSQCGAVARRAVPARAAPRFRLRRPRRDEAVCAHVRDRNRGGGRCGSPGASGAATAQLLQPLLEEVPRGAGPGVVGGLVGGGVPER